MSVENENTPIPGVTDEFAVEMTNERALDIAMQWLEGKHTDIPKADRLAAAEHLRAVDARRQLDLIARPEDLVDVEIQDRPGIGLVLYVHVNSSTVLRICRIQQEVEVHR